MLAPTLAFAASPKPIPSPVLSAPPAVAEPRSPSLAVQPTNTGALRPLPVTSRSPRFAGEHDELEWPIYLTDADLQGPVSLQLAYRSAVSVMPEASRLSVTLNGRAIENRRLEAAPNRRLLTIDLPTSGLSPGWNALRIAVAHRHRVDCSLGSTYELWTDLDPATSGLVTAMADRAPVASLADLAVARPDSAGVQRLRLVVSRQASAEDIAIGSRAATLVARLAGLQRPVVELAQEPGSGPGLDIVLGGRLSGVTVQSGADGRPMLTLGGMSRHDWQADLDLIDAALAARPGTPEGLAALARIGGWPVRGGEMIRFSDLAVESREFGGRVFRVTTDIAMPADFFPADYDKVRIRLAGGYRGGLTDAARIVVRVNGKVAAGLPLASPTGDVFRDRTIALPLAHFTPGLNRVEIDAQVPTAGDQDCDMLAQLDQPARFLFLNQTSIAMPMLARAGRFPDLAATVGGGLDPATTIYVPHPDADSVGAAMTLATRIGISGPPSAAPRFVFRAPPGDGAPALLVASHTDLPTAVVTAMGLTSDHLRKVWGHHAALSAPRPQAGLDPLDRRVAALRLAQAARDGEIVTGSIAVPAQMPQVGGKDLYASWQSDLHGQSWLSGLLSGLSQLTGSATTPLSALVTGPSAPAIPPLLPTTGLLVAQTHFADGPLTIVTAPNPRALTENLTNLTDPARWPTVAGRALTLDMVDLAVATAALEPGGGVRITNWSISNMRLVLAGLFSESPLVLGILVMALAAALGVATHLFVRRVGVRV
jgi:hypothetical protein